MKKTLFILITFLISVVICFGNEIDYYKLGKTYFEKNELDKAIQNFETAIKSDKAKPEAYLMLAKASYLAKKFETSHKAFSEILQRISLSERKDYYFMAAEAAAFSKNYDIALFYIEEIKKQKIQVLSGDINKLSNFIDFKKTELTLLNKALENKKEYFIELGNFYRKHKLENISAKYFLKAFNLHHEKDVNITNDLAKYYLEQGGKFQSKKFFLMTLAARPFDKTATYEMGKIYFNEADYEQSIAMFSRLKKVDNSYIPYLYLGEIYASTPGSRFLPANSIVNDAITLLKEAEKRGARSEKLYTLLSNLYRNMDDNNYEKYSQLARVFREESVTSERISSLRARMKIERLKELSETFKNDSRLKNVLFDLAKAYSQNKEYQAARDTLEKVISIDNTNHRYYQFLGLSYFKLNDIEKAIIAFNRSILLNRNNHASYYYLSKIYLLPEYLDYNKHIYNLEQSIRIKPNETEYLIGLSRHYIKTNDIKQLNEVYIKLNKLGKGFKKEIEKLSLRLKLVELEKDFSWSYGFEKSLKHIIEIRLKLDPKDPKILSYISEARKKEKYTLYIDYYNALWRYHLFCKDLREEDINSSIKILNEIISRFPYFTDAYYLLSKIYLYGKVDTEKAKEILEECKKRAMGYDHAQIQNILEMINTETFDETGELIKIGRAMYKNNSSFYSLEYLNRAFQKSPKNKRLLLFIAEIYKDKMDYDKAIYYYQKALEAEQWGPEVFIALGNAYFAKYLNTPQNIDDFIKNYNGDLNSADYKAAIEKLRVVLNDTRIKALNAYKGYIQHRMPFVLRELNPSNPHNIVQYLESQRLADEYILSKIGYFLLKNNHIEKGLKIFTTLYENNKTNQIILTNLLRAYKIIKNNQGILDTYLKLVSTFPNDDELKKELGNFYYKTNSLDKALQIYHELFLKNKLASTEMLIAKTYKKMKNYEEAYKYYSSAISKLAGNEKLSYPEAFFFVASVKRKKGDVLEALPLFEEALSGIKQNTFTEKFLRYKPILSRIYNELSSINLVIGKYRQSFNWLIEARIFDPSNVLQYDSRIGDILFLSSRFQFALSYYKNIIESKPNDIETLYKMAICYNEINQPIRSLRKMQRIQKITQNNMSVENFLYLGDLLFNSGKIDNAYRVYQSAYNKDKTDYRVYVKLAEIMKHKGNINGAISLLISGVSCVINKNNLYSFIAWYMAERNVRLDEASMFAQKALLDDPNNITYLKTAAFLFYKTGDILKYFRIMKNIETLNNEVNIISTDFFNYMYSHKKAYSYFKNKSYLLSVSEFYNDKDILKLKDKIESQTRVSRN